MKTLPSKKTVIDLFSGAGGLSLGLSSAGFEIRAAVELDATSAASYSLNHRRTPVIRADIRRLTGPDLLKVAGVKRGELGLLTGCPPCQGFSALRTKRRTSAEPDPRNDLVFEFLRLIRSIRPRSVLMENVPGLADDFRFSMFLSALSQTGYEFDYKILDAQNFGVPQRRKRLVLIALRDAQIPRDWFRGTGHTVTVRQAIGQLPKPGCSGDLLHDLPERRQKSIMDRIRATPKNGGGQRDVADELRCVCHKRSDGYSDVYGRMEWDSISPTITSGCHNPSKGRFLHPEEDRAITLREAALLQTFPDSYRFDLSRGKEHVAKQIGNAFPPRLISPIAHHLAESISK